MKGKSDGADTDTAKKVAAWTLGLSSLSIQAAEDCAARLAGKPREVAAAETAPVVLVSDDASSDKADATPAPGAPLDVAGYEPPAPKAGVVPPHILALALKAHALYPVVPVSVTLAQWAKESGWSMHLPPNSNNPFGIKCYDSDRGCSAAMTSEWDDDGKKSRLVQKFQVFKSFEDAFTSHARLLATSDYYEKARNASDVDGFVRGLTEYATDGEYIDSLIHEFLKPYNLYKYDQCETAAVDW